VASSFLSGLSGYVDIAVASSFLSGLSGYVDIAVASSFLSGLSGYVDKGLVYCGFRYFCTGFLQHLEVK
jgi:hypothetical protein